MDHNTSWSLRQNPGGRSRTPARSSDPTRATPRTQEGPGDTILIHGQVLGSIIGGHDNVNTINIHHNTYTHPNINKDEDKLDKLHRSKNASYDRAIHCLSGTRVDILNEINDWIDSREPGNNLFWLRGVAGSGKSTIASTVAANLDTTPRQSSPAVLGTTFFCSRDNSALNDPFVVLPTIAFYLACIYPSFREAVISALKANPDIGRSHIANQFQKLIEEPISTLSNDTNTTSLVVIIDAADECGDASSRAALLSSLARVRFFPVWFKLLITSRPEPDIMDHLYEVSCGHELNLLSDQTHADIRAYVEDRFGYLRKVKRRLKNDWPGETKVDQLVSNARGLFIWVTLSFKFISNQPDPNEALNVVLKPSGQDHLDVLYQTVLSRSLPKEKQHFELVRRILGCIVVSRIPLSLSSICALLEITETAGQWAIDQLASVLHTSSESALHVIHPSFLDFLTDHGRSLHLFIDTQEHNLFLARGCLGLMNRSLQRNICQVEHQDLFNDDILDLESRLTQFVPEHLSYGCLFWSEHVKATPNEDTELLALLHDFCYEHMMHWMEVMSLNGEARNLIPAIQIVIMWLPLNHSLVNPLRELNRFCGAFGYVISRLASHIYVSASTFTPVNSYPSQLSRRNFHRPPELKNPPENLQDPALLTLVGHTDGVRSVAFSPDGTKIVSSSSDHTVRVWDAASGQPILAPLVGHHRGVTSVAFSPDGTKIVSGSEDYTVRVWDAALGQPILAPLVGHSDQVTSVAFSPDGTKIVSGSLDGSLRVWDAASGQRILAPLMGHTHQVASVAFSPDGNKIVSGSHDKTVRVWDAASGKPILVPLVGHSYQVTSATFSPDGTKIISGSSDRTVRVWDAASGQPILAPLVGHTDYVNSVAFSPDGTKIVSSSYDETVRVWDAASGQPTPAPLVGHTGRVTSATFSPDGTKIVSGSSDGTVRVWDAASEQPILAPLVGHTDNVNSVAFSPDGTKIVSGSSDGTVRVWDAASVQPILAPLVGHTGRVTPVAFSPDGTKIVSGSSDCTMRVWDAASGQPILAPFVGHSGGVRSVTFSPDGTKILSGSSDGTVRVWDAASGQPILAPLVSFTGRVTSATFSLDGTKIVSGSYETVQVWDAASGQLILAPLVGHSREVSSVAFSPDGTKIVSCSEDEKPVRVWDAASGQPILAPLVGHSSGVRSVAFSPDGTKIVSVSSDRTVRVWNVASGQPILGNVASGLNIGGSQVLFWIPPHLGNLDSVALYGTDLVWFNTRRSPLIATRPDTLL